MLQNKLLVNTILNHSQQQTLSLSNQRTVLLYRRHDGVPVTLGKPADGPASSEIFTLSPCERNALYESCSCNMFNIEQLHFGSQHGNNNNNNNNGCNYVIHHSSSESGQ